MSSKRVQRSVSSDPDNQDGDAGLMLRVGRDDMEAFAELVGRHQRQVTALAYRYLGNAAEAEDLAQEAFLRVFRFRARYEPRAKFSTWLHRIVVNVCLNTIRARKSRPLAPRGGGLDGDAAVPERADHDAPHPGARLEQQEMAEHVKRAVDSLPESQRLAILMNKYQDMSYQEIGDAMGLTTMAVKSLLTRARVNIRNKLTPYLRDGRGS
jgi:RNA polymerase sigma-70 factor, ECF subfamily